MKIELPDGYRERLEHSVVEFCERARRKSDAPSSAELLAENRLRLVRRCEELRGGLSPDLSSLREAPSR